MNNKTQELIDSARRPPDAVTQRDDLTYQGHKISKTEESLRSAKTNKNNIKKYSLNQNSQLLTNAQMNEVIKKERKHYYGKCLLVLVLLMITHQYISYVFMLEYLNMKFSSIALPLIRLIVFHILFVLLLASLYLASKTNPGTIPLYWGFYIGDQEYKKKRYCLLCQVFKPDRTHHCSICNICVLNMDHHCPWINNCIGFYNRKYFIQLLIYFLLSVFYLDIIYIPHSINSGLLLYKNRHSANISLMTKCFLIIFNHLILLVLTFLDFEFLKYHIKLVLSNATTIESLDADFMKKNKYNINKKENWEQVFGTNKFYWFLPYVNEKSYPKGDGLTWPLNDLGDDTQFREKTSARNDNASLSAFASFVKQNTNSTNNFNSNFKTTTAGLGSLAGTENNFNTINNAQSIEMAETVRKE